MCLYEIIHTHKKRASGLPFGVSCLGSGCAFFLAMVFGLYACVMLWMELFIVDDVVKSCCKLHAYFLEKINSYSYSYSEGGECYESSAPN